MALKKNIGLGIRTSLVLGASFLATSYAVAGGLFQISLSDYPTTAPMPTLSWELSNPLPPNNVIQSGTGTPNAQGILSINPTTDGVYDVRISGSHFLADKLASVRVHAYPDLGPYDVMLVNGDINQDDSVDLLDYFDLSDAYNTVPGDPAWNADCDLNADESVDLLDYFILSENWLLTGTENPRKLTSRGREFWVAFLPAAPIDFFPVDDPDPQPSDKFTIEVAGTPGTVIESTVSGVTPPLTTTIGANGLGSQEFTTDAIHHGIQGVSNRCIRVTANKPISLSQSRFVRFGSDASTAIPLQSLGLEHVVVGYPSESGSHFAVIAPYGNSTHSLTTLKITPSVNFQEGVPRIAGQEYEVTLAAGEIYYARRTSTGTVPLDLTGTIIKSNHPVAVLSGSQAAGIEYRIPPLALSANHLVEQIPSVDQHDTEFLVAPFMGGSKPGYVRVVASRNNTLVTGATSFPHLLHRGEFLEVRMVMGQGMRIVTSKPALVAQFAESGSNDSDGDPSFVLVPGVHSYGTRASLSVPDLPGFTYLSHPTTLWSYATTVFAPSSYVGQVRHNATLIPSAEFVTIPGSTYSFARIAIAPGSHEFDVATSDPNTTVGAIGYGKNVYDSFALSASENYTYVGGPSAAPNTPTGLTATTQQDPQTTEWSVNLSWTDNSTNEEGFILDRRNSSTASWTRVATLAANATSYSDSGAPADATVSYRVRAISDLNSAFSNVADAPTPPHAPTATTSWFDAHNSVRVLWTDGSSVETGFDILRKTTSGSWAVVGTVAANTLQYTDTSTQPLTTYQYTIRAKRDALVSATSNVLSGQTPDIPPLAPTISATAVSDTQINVSVTGGLRSTGAYLYRRESGTTDWTAVQNFSISAGVTVGPIAVTGLDGLTQYEFKAYCNNSGGNSPDATASATTLMPPPPAAPTNLVAKALYDDEVKLTWEDNATNEKKYIVQRRLTSGTTWTTVTANVPKNSTSYNDRTVSGNTDYTYRVAASNAGGDTWSNESAAKTPVTPVAHTPYLSKLEILDDCVVGEATVRCRVERSKRSSSPMSVSISVEQGFPVTAPVSVVIPANERFVEFTLQTELVAHQEEYISASITAESAGYAQVDFLSLYSSADSLQISIRECTGLSGGVLIRFDGIESSAFGNTISGYQVWRHGFGPAQIVGVNGRTTEFIDTTAMPGVQYTYVVGLMSPSGSVISSDLRALTGQVTEPDVALSLADDPLTTNDIELNLIGSGIGRQRAIFANGWLVARDDLSAHENTVGVAQLPVAVGSSNMTVAMLIEPGNAQETIRISSPVLASAPQPARDVLVDGVIEDDKSAAAAVTFDWGTNTDMLTIALEDESGQTLRTWQVLGGSGTLALTGRSTGGSSFGSGVRAVKLTKAQETRRSSDIYQSQGVMKHLALIMNGDNTYTESNYPATTRTSVRAAYREHHSMARSMMARLEPGPTVGKLAMLFSERSGLSPRELAQVRTWLAKSVEFLFFLGHGLTDGRNPEYTFSGFKLGDESVRLDNTDIMGGDHIHFPNILKQRRLRLTVFSACFAWGSDFISSYSSESNGNVTRFPNQVWKNVIAGQYGGILGFNGSSYVSVNFNGLKNRWFDFNQRLMDELGDNVPIGVASDRAVNWAARQGSPLAGSTCYPWDSWTIDGKHITKMTIYNPDARPRE